LISSSYLGCASYKAENGQPGDINFLNGLYLAKKYNYKILIDETRFIRYKKFKPILSEIIKKAGLKSV
jgi:hypothetical protein